jgi:hypothetical protein
MIKIASNSCILVFFQSQEASTKRYDNLIYKVLLLNMFYYVS